MELVEVGKTMNVEEISDRMTWLRNKFAEGKRESKRATQSKQPLAATKSPFATYLGSVQALGACLADVEPRSVAMKWPTDMPVAPPMEHEADELKKVVLATSKALLLEPRIRAGMRRLYRTVGTLSTSLTKRGMREITPSHEFYAISNITTKPFHAFLTGKHQAQVLVIAQAVRDGMVVVSSNADEMVSAFLEGLCVEYLQEASSYLPKCKDSIFTVDWDTPCSWDQLRFKALHEACFAGFMTVMHDSLVDELEKKAKLYVVDECASALERMVVVKPLSLPVLGDPLIKHAVESQRERMIEAIQLRDMDQVRSLSLELPETCFKAAEDCRLVSVFVVGEDFDDRAGQNMTVAVAMNGYGEVFDHVKLAKFDSRGRDSMSRDLRVFIEGIQPSLVVINSGLGTKARGLLIELQAMAKDIVATKQKARAKRLRKAQRQG